MRRGRYYLGRVVKTGQLNQEMLRTAIIEAPTVPVAGALWTITDTLDETHRKNPFIFGRLSKYSREGQLTVVDPVAHSQVDATAENLLIAASPFIYLPDFSGIAYLHVWNGVQEEVFRRRFSRVIEEAHQRFFVGCEVDPVADYRAFVTKLTALEKILEIRAKVHPPNPLFGDLWRDLNEYIRQRNASEVVVAEKSDQESGLTTQIVALIRGILSKATGHIEKPAAITDAALLMAADGYGSGKVIGQKENEQVVIRTSDTQKNFLHSKEPDVEELALIVRRKFETISEERDMGHG